MSIFFLFLLFVYFPSIPFKCTPIHLYYFVCLFRTNTYPKIPDRFRALSDPKALPDHQQQQQYRIKATTTTIASSNGGNANKSIDGTIAHNQHSMHNKIPSKPQDKNIDRNQEEIYF